jgi:hypothetical protein
MSRESNEMELTAAKLGVERVEVLGELNLPSACSRPVSRPASIRRSL